MRFANKNYSERNIDIDTTIFNFPRIFVMHSIHYIFAHIKDPILLINIYVDDKIGISVLRTQNVLKFHWNVINSIGWKAPDIHLMVNLYAN